MGSGLASCLLILLLALAPPRPGFAQSAPGAARPAGSAPGSLTLNTNDIWPRSSPDGAGFEDRILAEAFRRLGLSYEIVRLPSERALISAEQGIVDGDYVRISGLEKSYPGLVMVAEAVSRMDFTAFALSPGPRIDGWEDLAGLSVGHIRGWKIVEERLRGHPRVTSVKDEESLFALLRAGKVDAVVYERLEGERYLRAAGGATGIKPVKTLESRDMYLYLNLRHAALAPRLAAKLRDMRAEGLIEAITAEVKAAPPR